MFCRAFRGDNMASDYEKLSDALMGGGIMKSGEGNMSLWHLIAKYLRG